MPESIPEISNKTQKAIERFCIHLSSLKGKIYIKRSPDHEVDLIKTELIKINPEWADRIVIE